jgi:hypothetical protein
MSDPDRDRPPNVSDRNLFAGIKSRENRIAGSLRRTLSRENVNSAQRYQKLQFPQVAGFGKFRNVHEPLSRIRRQPKVFKPFQPVAMSADRPSFGQYGAKFDNVVQQAPPERLRLISELGQSGRGFFEDVGTKSSDRIARGHDDHPLAREEQWFAPRRATKCGLRMVATQLWLALIRQGYWLCWRGMPACATSTKFQVIRRPRQAFGRPFFHYQNPRLGFVTIKRHFAAQ